MGEQAAVVDDRVAALVEAQLPLVRQIVFQVAVHFPRHVDRDDLARAGALGLFEAARRWDQARGVPFERFAARRIKGAILDAVRAADWAPRSVRVASRRLEQAEHRLVAQLGRAPTADELAAALDLAPQELARLNELVHRSVVLALDQAVPGDDEPTRLSDLVRDHAAGPDEELEGRELLGYLHDAVQLLPERHRRVIVGYFLDGTTSRELAAALGVSESRISQLRSEALEVLRAGIEAQYEPRPGSAAPASAAPGPPGAGRRRLGVRLAERGAEYAQSIRRASDLPTRLDRGAVAVADMA